MLFEQSNADASLGTVTLIPPRSRRASQSIYEVGSQS
jgi:hypothetical protein